MKTTTIKLNEKIRPIRQDELDKVNKLVRIAKQYWGYSDHDMDIFMEKYGITKVELENNPPTYYLLENENEIIGLYGFSYDKINNHLTLEYLCTRPKYMRQYYGTKLWNYAVELFNTQYSDINSFILFGDPNTEEFYKKMGCEVIEHRKSIFGKTFPVMKYSR